VFNATFKAAIDKLASTYTHTRQCRHLHQGQILCQWKKNFVYQVGWTSLGGALNQERHDNLIIQEVWHHCGHR